MKFRNVYKRKRRTLSSRKIVIIMFVCIVGLSIAYSSYVANLQINGTVTLVQLTNVLAVGTHTVYGVTITVDNEGIITLDGTYTGTKAMYVRLTDKFVAEVPTGNNTQMFLSWINDNDTSVLVYQPARIIHSVEIISGTWNNSAQFNVVLRNQANVAIANCQLSNGIYSANASLDSNAVVEYLYMTSGSSFTNFKIKPTITTITRMPPNFIAGQEIYNGITCTLSADGTITLNGTANSKIFIKLTDGINVNTTAISSWVSGQQIYGMSNETITFSANVLSGSATSKDCNLCLRDSTNSAAAIIELTNGQSTIDVTPSSDIKMVYLFIQKGAVCSNLILRPTITTP